MARHNSIARDLRTPKYRQRIVRSKLSKMNDRGMKKHELKKALRFIEKVA